MDVQAATMRDTALLFTGVVIGAILSPVLALVGLPLAAAGIAGLAYRGHAVVAAFAVAVGVAAAAAFQPMDALYVAPALVAVLVAASFLPKARGQVVAGWLIGALLLMSVAYDELLARSQGSTLTASITKQMQVIAREVGAALAGSGQTEAVSKLGEIARTMALAWPSAYFETAVLVGVAIIVALAWAARRAGRDVDVPPLSRLDLTPHVLWAFVVGLLLLAASYGSIPASATVGAIGLNLVLCARTLFFLQGISVSAGVLDRAGVGLGGRIFALAALAALDALTLVVSFVGLLDFWVNFRRLPRDGVTTDAPVEADAERRW